MIAELPIQGFPSGKRPPYVVVAASDTPDFLKKSADYICDGTDDQVEIQQAINELASSGGTVVLLPGEYNIYDDISINSENISIYGLFSCTSTKLSFKVEDKYLNITSSNVDIKNISIYNMKITGSESNHISNITLENIVLDNYAYIEYVEDLKILKSLIYACEIDIYNSERILISKNNIVGTYFDIENSNKININDNMLCAPDFDICSIDVMLFSNNHFNDGEVYIWDSSHIMISNNRFYWVYIELCAEKSTITHNLLHDTYEAENSIIYICGNENTITSNILNLAAAYPIITINGSNNILSNNLIEGIGATKPTRGVRLTDTAESNIISNNIIKDVVTGIEVESNNNNISMNTIISCTDKGIYINGAYNRIISNHIDSANYGIYLDTNSQYSYIGKNIITNSTTANISDNGTNNIFGLYDYANNKDNYA